MNEGGGDILVKPQRLPCEAYEGFRQVLALPALVAQSLERFARLVTFVWDKHLPRSPLNGILLFAGPPGTGKTLAAKVLAQGIAAHRQVRSGQETLVFPVHIPALLSEYLGQSARTVARFFENVAFSAERRFTILFADEIEVLAFSRARVSSADPSDVVRVVDELLRQIDALRGNPNFLMIATTNLASILDVALIDRADLVVRFENPDIQAADKILHRAALEARQFGIAVSSEDIYLAADALSNHGAASRPSGRLLSKLPLLAYIDSGETKLTAEALIATARRKMAAGEA